MIRTLIAFALLAVCVPVFAQETIGTIPPIEPVPTTAEAESRVGPTICISKRPTAPAYELSPDARFIGPTLPCFTRNLSDNDYKWWVIQQNEIAYQQAESQRDNARAGSVVRESRVYGPSAGVRYGGFNNYTTRETTVIAPGSAPYGGGGVWIHNPFVRQ